MNLTELTAISPIDGRYRSKSVSVATYFSEYALIKYRVIVEIEYFIELCAFLNIDFSNENENKLREIIINFNISDSQRIKDIEKITNHDVKAVEYYLREKFEELNISEFKELIHFGLTSQDINNTAVPLSLKDYIHNEYFPLVNLLVDKIIDQSKEWQKVPMLAYTHGQAASPTILGKEFYVFVSRLKTQLAMLKEVPFSAKFGGATGNFNAHAVAYPNRDWNHFGDRFVNQVLKLHRSTPTTQIEHYDNLAALFDNLKRINTILIDFNRDIWTYISMNYFKQTIKKEEVGSSAMPHKVNPIDFENSEGNLGIANAIFEHLSAKLPISRLQRDLTDSTVLRNIGVPLAHTAIAFQSTLKGLNKLILNEIAINNDLNDNWAVVAEAIQTILRREKYPNPYDALKQLTRNNQIINQESILQFIDNLNVSDEIKLELKKITPQNYTGVEFIIN